jgi:hypothetical protein
MAMGDVRLETILAEPGGTPARRLILFALLTLGVIESFANGLMSPTDAVRSFFNADNCVFVHNRLKDKVADKIMSHGAQLVDLFDILTADEARRQVQHELSAMRSLCLRLLDAARPVA